MADIDLINAANKHIAGGQTTLDAIAALVEPVTGPGIIDFRVITHFCPEVGFQFTVASINTNIVMRLLGSYTGGAFFPAEPDLTITVNGTYVVHTTKKLHSMRLQFVSEAGGADATITGIVGFAG